jgi:hypothetical protein
MPKTKIHEDQRRWGSRINDYLIGSQPRREHTRVTSTATRNRPTRLKQEVVPDFDELPGFAKRIIRFSLSELEGSGDTTLSVNNFSLDWHEDDPEDGTSNHRQHTRNSDSLDTATKFATKIRHSPYYFHGRQMLSVSLWSA